MVQGNDEPAAPVRAQATARRVSHADLRALTAAIAEEEDRIRLGGGPSAIQRQHEKGRKTARERIAALFDPGAEALELGLWAAFGVYEEWGARRARGL
jgi:acetyl-CoA carboxylase carboxyltransferase component